MRPVGLYTITGLGGNEGRSQDRTLILALLEVAIDDVAAGTGFVDEAQFQFRFGKFFEELVQGIESAADLPVGLGFGVALSAGGPPAVLLFTSQTHVLYFCLGCLFRPL